jgi:molybdopterin-guanine dinucleotide biosynthesis protein A
VRYDLVVLAGGRARRLGGADKPALPLADGPSSLERVLAGCGGAARVVVVGPRRRVDVPTEPRWTVESPPGGGPLSAVAAALPLTSAAVVVVVAADMPLVSRAVPHLVRTVLDGDSDAAVLVDDRGVRQPLAGAYRRRRLVQRMQAIGDPAGRPARLLLEDANVTGLPDAWGAAADFDTWPDRRRIEELLRDE